ncbi:MAG: hypothetical protein ACRD3F_01815, partial [Acidobacteriaceae bacterium]
MKKITALLALLFATLVIAGSACAQAPQSPDANAQKARTKLQAMLAALGGQRWLSLQNIYTE